MFKKNGGFTLVELIIVIAILAILAAITIPNYADVVTDAQEKVTKYQNKIDDDKDDIDELVEKYFTEPAQTPNP